MNKNSLVTNSNLDLFVVMIHLQKRAEVFVVQSCLNDFSSVIHSKKIEAITNESL